MKSRTSIALMFIAVLTSLTISTRLAAQDNAAAAPAKPAQHHHYQLIDLGTFGGPTSGLQLAVVCTAGGFAFAHDVGSVPNGVKASAREGGANKRNLTDPARWV